MEKLFDRLQAVDKIKNVKLIIEHDEKIGFYLFVYDLVSGECTKDYLYFPEQLNDLYSHVARTYGISKDSFYPISNNPEN